MLKPLQLMLSRMQSNGMESDVALFNELLYVAEFITKITTLSMVSALEIDVDNYQYRLLHAAVRADGIGEWAALLDQALTGPASQHLCQSSLEIRRVYTERSMPHSWQDRAIKSLSRVLFKIQPEANKSADRPQFRWWFQSFAELRNKTRGHGALTPATASSLIEDLRESIDIVVNHNPVLNLPWAYLHRNFSGKYRVVPIGGDPAPFETLKKAVAIESENHQPGIYIYLGGYRRVNLFMTDVNVADFYVPNGAFRNTTYELHSPITDNRQIGDATPYLAPATERPDSETAGLKDLDPVGLAFSNIPPMLKGYIKREYLEKEIKDAVINDRHPIVTLVGRGGIGKTSTALTVLHEVAKSDRFYIIVWFSARDIDLTVSGAKPVRPQALTEKEISKVYLDLIGYDYNTKKENPQTIMASHLRHNPNGTTLFVFDNFETVRSPIDLFSWIDTNIRLPNKAIITSRFRDFKADYPIAVPGMEGAEAEELIRKTAHALQITRLIGITQTAELVHDSDGHPYVIKILLGEIANAQSYSKPIKIIARKEDILDALFERTYSALPPLAVRAFLTLCSWNSLIPQLGLEAVLMRQIKEMTDPEAAIDYLVTSSLVARVSAPDGSDFLRVPLTAAVFGKRKLAVSPIRIEVENDVKFLQEMGSTADTGLKNGLAPRIETFFRRVAARATTDKSFMEESRPILEFFARKHHYAWMLIARIDRELGNDVLAAEALRKYLETQPEKEKSEEAWRQLWQIYHSGHEVVAASYAFVQAALIVPPPIPEISAMANWLNNSAKSWEHFEVVDRVALFRPLADIMENEMSQANATDFSRLAWLHLHANNPSKALEVTLEGLKCDPENTHCLNLIRRLKSY